MKKNSKVKKSIVFVAILLIAIIISIVASKYFSKGNATNLGTYWAKDSKVVTSLKDYVSKVTNPNDKAKNFKDAIKRLLKELKGFKVFIIISLILAMFGAILSISAPNRLSKMTDEISKGLVINTKNFKEVTKRNISE